VLREERRGHEKKSDAPSGAKAGLVGNSHLETLRLREDNANMR